MAKHIFVMGGVLSSLGKGIASSSIGLLLKKMGYNVGLQKMDPYLNVDPGTMSPYQHGEVFVTDDGAETDLDLGHYERFIDVALSKLSSVSSGQIYESVIKKERRGDYLGKTVQVIPHITNEIISKIKQIGEMYDIVITEIGGTVGDIESLPFLEAVRQFRMEVGYENSLFVLLTYVPFIKSAGELKTKPTQHSAIKLREIGIQPDILLCRSEKPFSQDIINKISLFTNVPIRSVINAIDVKSVFSVPGNYFVEGLHETICKQLRLETREIDFTELDNYIKRTQNYKDEVTVAVCGKYVQHQDAYKSVEQAIVHAGIANDIKVNIEWIDSEMSFDNDLDKDRLKKINGILIPGGFGLRGIEGKVNIVRYARENNIPFFGICLGMQVAVIEFARNVCNIKDAFSSEFDHACENPVIHLMDDQSYIDKLGGTMRLGAFPCKIYPQTLAWDAYQNEVISERHRHRYEFNNAYREIMQENGLVISGTSPDGLLVEIIEYPKNDFFVAVQFHPEFLSRPLRPHPIFNKFIQSSLKKKNKV
ncbi:CTP synthase [bacterium]|nr:CTP synthase [bacterium]